MTRPKRLILKTAAMILLALAGPAELRGQTNSFYQGKTVRIVVGSTPGGFYDRWARLLARYIPKYIPGNPNFVVQNMPGASSVVAANYVYNLAKADGLTLVMPINSLHLDQIVGRREVKYDVRKFEFIGSQEKTPTMMYFRADSPIKSLGDIIQAKEPPKCGSRAAAFWPGTLRIVAQEKLRPPYISRRTQARCALGGGADAVRAAGSIQVAGDHAQPNPGHSGERRTGPSDDGRTGCATRAD
jgi:hypothetical protein